MEHLILTETEFFRLIDNPESRNGLSAAYNEFVATVISLCTGAASPCHPLPALSYAETELQYHKALQDTGNRPQRVRAQSPRLRAQNAETHFHATQPSAATILHPLPRRKEK